MLAATHLISGHERKVDMLQQHRKFRAPVLGVCPDPPEHSLVDGTLGSHQELLAGDEPDELVLGELREVFGGLHDPLEVLQDEGLGVDLQLVGPEVDSSEVVRYDVSGNKDCY